MYIYSIRTIHLNAVSCLIRKQNQPVIRGCSGKLFFIYVHYSYQPAGKYIVAMYKLN